MGPVRVKFPLETWALIQQEIHTIISIHRTLSGCVRAVTLGGNRIHSSRHGSAQRRLLATGAHSYFALLDFLVDEEHIRDRSDRCGQLSAAAYGTELVQS
jgi:hypothetical protein